MRHLKRDFAAGIYLSEVQNPILPPLTHCILILYIIQYMWLFTQGKGGAGESSTKENVGGATVIKLGRIPT
jgi:hypothetical protein